MCAAIRIFLIPSTFSDFSIPSTFLTSLLNVDFARLEIVLIKSARKDTDVSDIIRCVMQNDSINDTKRDWHVLGVFLFSKSEFHQTGTNEAMLQQFWTKVDSIFHEIESAKSRV